MINYFFLHYGIYWFVSAFFYLMDMTIYKLDIVEHYKQNRITQQYWSYCWTSAKSAFLNQIFITWPLIYFFEDYMVDSNMEFSFISASIKLFFYMMCADFWFFTFHIACHKIPIIYKKIHKFHHRVFTTSAVSALDAHPLEHLFVNLGSVAFGPLLWLGDMWTIAIWIVLATGNTCFSHSGFRGSIFGRSHNIHHRLCKYNYGIGFNLFDRIFGEYFMIELDV